MAMEVDEPQYRLRYQLVGHEDDVRGICVCGEFGIATGSRDRTVRFWSPAGDDDRGYELSKTLVGHKNFVGPVAYIPPNSVLPSGGLVSGGMDASVIVWDLQSGSLKKELTGHKLQVSCVAIDSEGQIVSASVDGTVRRWRKGNNVEVLSDHQGPVQAVIVLASGELVTGSSDQTIKIWRGGTCVDTFTGHSDTVRGLAYLPHIGILSASHDCTVRMWSESGEVLQEMVGHTAIVYSVAVNSVGEVASGSEDAEVKIWREGVCCQSIQHPGCVWDVKYLPNGDLVTACSDGIARVWTLDSSRVAPSHEIEQYEAQVAARKMEMKTVGGVKVADLPGIEALEQPGSKDGQTKIVREGNTGVAYSWDEQNYKWNKIGEVVDGPSDAVDKRTLNGVTYDYVFDVDIEDGVPPRKLPYNKGQNPNDVADQFLIDEGLPSAYRPQIVDFILRNTGEATPKFDSAYVDPYTGANAYVPSPNQSWGTNAASGVPPNGPAKVSTISLKHLPKRGALFFDTAQYDALVKKLVEFNAALSSDEATKPLSLTDLDVRRLHAICKTLKETSRYHVSKFADADFELLTKILLFWPVDYLFPALDLLRMCLLHPHAANHFAKNWKDGKDVIMDAIIKATTNPVLPGNQLTSARLAVNSFRHTALRNWAIHHRSEILDVFSECCSAPSKNVRLAYSTLVLNYAVVLIDEKDEPGQLQVLSAALEMAGSKEEDAEVQFRALVAVGSLMHSGLVKTIAIDLDVKAIVDSALISPTPKISEVGSDLKSLLEQ